MEGKGSADIAKSQSKPNADPPGLAKNLSLIIPRTGEDALLQTCFYLIAGTVEGVSSPIDDKRHMKQRYI